MPIWLQVDAAARRLDQAGEAEQRARLDHHHQQTLAVARAGERAAAEAAQRVTGLLKKVALRPVAWVAPLLRLAEFLVPDELV